jgi:hypothetical protein
MFFQTLGAIYSYGLVNFYRICEGYKHWMRNFLCYNLNLCYRIIVLQVGEQRRVWARLFVEGDF